MTFATFSLHLPAIERPLQVERGGTKELFIAAVGTALVLMLLRLAVLLPTQVHLEVGAFLNALLGASLALSLAMLLLGAGCERLASVVLCWALYEIGAVALGDCTIVCFAAGRHYAMVDGSLAAIDRALGFDWPGYLLFVDRHPALNDLVLRPAYLSIFWQPAVAAVALPMLGRARDAFALLLSFSLGIMACCAFAVFTPAYGAYHFHALVPAMHPHVTDLVTGDGIADALDWLRLEAPAGRLPVNRGGLITFPSFHTAAAVLLIWAFRRVRLLFAPALALNVAMLVATPLHGSHYIADMIAGAMIAAAVIAAVGRLVDAGCSLAERLGRDVTGMSGGSDTRAVPLPS